MIPSSPPCRLRNVLGARASPHSPRRQSKHLQNVCAVLAPPIRSMKGNESLTQDETSDDDRQGKNDESAECDSEYEEINGRCSEIVAGVSKRCGLRCVQRSLTGRAWRREDISGRNRAITQQGIRVDSSCHQRGCCRRIRVMESRGQWYNPRRRYRDRKTVEGGHLVVSCRAQVSRGRLKEIKTTEASAVVLTDHVQQRNRTVLHSDSKVLRKKGMPLAMPQQCGRDQAV